jgi:hypothetical protein
MSQENTLLRAQIEQLKLEILEYVKRFTLIANQSGVSTTNAIHEPMVQWGQRSA